MITSRDGVAINYAVEGRGRHVTLLHGVGSHLEAWDGVVAALRDEFTLLRYDLRGHAKSGKPPAPYSLDDYVADLAALLDVQSVGRTTLVGFSFGGMIAPAFTVRWFTPEFRSQNPRSSSARWSASWATTPRATPQRIGSSPSPTASTI
jgi:pimeloyl-ACP methyl ester carboxylesterase